MNYKQDLLNWWLDKDPFTENEINFLDTPADKEPIFNDIKYSSLEKDYINRLLNSNISTNTYTITMKPCATDFINELFNYYVDDDTLVISSENEHENVKKNLDLCKNKIILNSNDIKYCKLNKIIPFLNDFSKIFVYIIGTQISTGEITPQLLFEKLKEELTNEKIPSIFILDDVHGSFIIPRDYSIFDYILNTAHALVKGYDVGILISNKTKKQFGIKAYNWGKGYLDRLNLILSRKDKLLCFKNVMEEYFYDYIIKKQATLLTKTAPHIFTMNLENITMNEELYNMFREYHIRFEGLTNGIPRLRLRAAQCLHHPAKLKEGFKKLEEFLPILIN